MLATTHLVDSEAPAVDRDGRTVVVGAAYAWQSAYGSRTGRCVRVERHGDPVAVVIASDTGGEVYVRARGLVRIAEGRPA